MVRLIGRGIGKGEGVWIERWREGERMCIGIHVRFFVRFRLI